MCGDVVLALLVELQQGKRLGGWRKLMGRKRVPVVSAAMLFSRKHSASGIATGMLSVERSEAAA